MLILSIALIIALVFWGAKKLDERDKDKHPVSTNTMVRVVIDGEYIWLDMEEFLPYEPSNYVTDPGWTCFDADGQEFFINTAGIVFAEATVEDAYGAERIEWREVGVCPSTEAYANVWEAQTMPTAELAEMFS